MTEFLQYVVTGIMVGSIYGLIAIGFVLIFKASSVFNLAQGEILVLSAFFSWSMMEQFHLPIWLAVILSLGFATILGFGLERFPLRQMMGQPILAIIMVTIALGAVLRGAYNMFWGLGGWRQYPEILSPDPLNLGALSVSRGHLYAFLIALFLLLALTLFFRYTRTGLAMLATAEDHQVAESTGIFIERTIGVTWAIACVVSLLGGILMGNLIGLDPNFHVVGLKALPAALLGGLESIPGAIIGGIIIGVLENLAAGYIGHGAQEITAFVVLVLVLFIRPYGFFGLKRIERI